MGEASRAIEFVDAAFRDALDRGLVHLNAQDDRLDGRHVQINGQPKLNFSSCSYLGLELDPRLKRGAIDAVERYGTQFSSSRSYISAPLYEELEALLDRIFQAHTVVTPSTTLAHLAALPVLIGEGDAVLLDHQVHQTVQLAIPHLRLDGVHVEIVRHGNIERLEERVRELSRSHRKVWYLADGIYSMYGDFAPTKALALLLARHEQLHVYLDDAHGMTWTGRHGRGFAAEQLAGHERVVIAVSLNKAFGAAGGALVLPNRDQQRKIRTCGGPLIFTGPIQPPMLGAAVAAARIHLSDEIHRLQRELLERIRFANRIAEELELPLASRCEVPIRYVALGLVLATFDMTAHLLEQGFYVNPAGFPAVGTRYSGVRFTLTRHHQFDDIRRLLETIAERYPLAMAAAGCSRRDVDRVFRLDRAKPRGAARPARRWQRRALPTRASSSLELARETTIAALDGAEWDRCLEARGSFGTRGLALLEQAFGRGVEPPNDWKFHYYVVRERGGRPVLATFFTDALWKDDLLSPAAVSKAIEERRQRDPSFLTSHALAMGSLLTEGNHLYLDRQADWRGALRLLLSALDDERERCKAPLVVFRDLPEGDSELADFLKGAGFVQLALPDSLQIDIDWNDRASFLAGRSKRTRRFHREKVEPWERAYAVEILKAGGRRPSAAEWAHLYRLYEKVRGRNLQLNTFALPPELFRRMIELPGWEILLLTLRPEAGGERGALPQGFMACHAGRDHYVPLLTGMDYRFVESHALYRQLLSQTVHRAEALGARRIAFGMGAEVEKARFGAKPQRRSLFAQSHDQFHHDVLSLITSSANLHNED